MIDVQCPAMTRGRHAPSPAIFTFVALLCGCPSHPAVDHRTSAAHDAAPAVDPGGAMIRVPGDSEVDRIIGRAQLAVRQDPTRVSRYDDLARGFVRKAREAADPGYYVQAQDAVDRALHIDANDFDALQLQTLLWLQDHRFGEVRDVARRLITRDMHNPMNFALLGDATMELGDYHTAEEAYQQMVDMRPNLPSYSRVSWMRWLLGDPQGATEAGQLAVDAGSPRVPEELAWVMVNLGQLHFGQGHLDDALRAFESALQVFPGYANARMGRGRVREARGDLAGAIEDYAAAAETSTLAEHLMALGDAQAQAHRDADATATYARFERIARRSDPRTLALFYANHDREHAAAVELAQHEMDRRGDEVFTQDVLAWALYRAGNIPEAQRYATLSRRLGTREARFAYHGGLIDMAAGNRVHAGQLLTAALIFNPWFDTAGSQDVRHALSFLGVAPPPLPNASHPTAPSHDAGSHP